MKRIIINNPETDPTVYVNEYDAGTNDGVSDFLLNQRKKGKAFGRSLATKAAKERMGFDSSLTAEQNIVKFAKRWNPDNVIADEDTSVALEYDEKVKTEDDTETDTDTDTDSTDVTEYQDTDNAS